MRLAMINSLSMDPIYLFWVLNWKYLMALILIHKTFVMGSLIHHMCLIQMTIKGAISPSTRGVIYWLSWS